MKTELWQSIGFQSKNPRTDFRAGGILSLLVLTYFCRTEKSLFDEMRQRSDWFLAISSVNISSTLLTYLYLSTEPVAFSHMKLKAGRVHIKNFARLNAKDKKTLFELHNLIFRSLFANWKRSVASVGDSRLPPNFNTVIGDTFKRFDNLLGARHYWNLEELRAAFNRDLEDMARNQT